ncbi:MAG TPA: hypothetical protein VF170_07735 [Planctomycetaceae bacterium]
MKGPGFRLDLDVRRVWECPACGRRLKTSGDVVRVDCDCRGDSPPAMRLVEKLHRTESPFDHVGFAAQKRIDAALRKSHAAEPEEVEPEEVDESDADLRPPDAALPETTHAIDADAPPPTDEAGPE